MKNMTLEEPFLLVSSSGTNKGQTALIIKLRVFSLFKIKHLSLIISLYTIFGGWGVFWLTVVGVKNDFKHIKIDYDMFG